MDFVCNSGGPKSGVGFLASLDPPVNCLIVGLVNFLLYSLLKRSICAMILHGIIYDGCQHPWVPVFCVSLGLMPCNVMRERVFPSRIYLQSTCVSSSGCLPKACKNDKEEEVMWLALQEGLPFLTNTRQSLLPSRWWIVKRVQVLICSKLV